MFLSGTLLNVATVLAGTSIGLLAGSRVPRRMQESLTAGLGFFTTVIALSMALPIFTSPDARPADELAVLGGLLGGVAIGELLRLHDGLEALGAWFQRRLSRELRDPAAGARDEGDPALGARDEGAGGGSRIAEGFVTASLVFCVGPLTILGSLENGLTGDVTLLATKSLLDFVASIAFAAALGAGVYLSALTVLVVQGGIAAGAFLLRDVMDPPTVLAVTAAGGLILLGVALRLLEIRQLRVANFLPALILAPLFLRVADLVRGWLA